MARAKKKREFPTAIEADLIPVLSCMFLLIPALLLAMEVASFAAVPVSPPRTTVTPADSATVHESFGFRVSVRTDGFEATVGTRGKDLPKTSIEMLRGANGDYVYDYATLGELAAHAKAQYPDESMVTVTAEGDVPLKTLVEAMDAVRGDDCSLLEIHATEQVPEGCLFWNVVIES